MYGHRGARGEAPENTLAGFRHLRSLNIHRVELDLQLSKDKQLVVLHDKTLNRTVKNHKGSVSNYLAEDLATFEFKFDKKTDLDTSFTEGTGVPSLAAVLAEWPELKSIQLEVKPPEKNQIDLMSQLLLSAIEEFNLQDSAIITSSSQAFLKHSRDINSNTPHGLVAGQATRKPVQLCLNLGCEYLIAHHVIITKRLVEKAHQSKIKVSSWTVNELRVANRLRELNIHSIISDVPQLTLPSCL